MSSEERIREITQNLIGDSAIFLVDLKIKSGNNLKIFLDGDNGINIDTISKINKSLYQSISEAKIFPEDDFSLEVSSPGIDAPLKLHRQYPKNIGRTVKVVLTDDSLVAGKLIEVEEDGITIEKEVKKKKDQELERNVVIPFEQIKTTTVELKF